MNHLWWFILTKTFRSQDWAGRTCDGRARPENLSVGVVRSLNAPLYWPLIQWVLCLLSYWSFCSHNHQHTYTAPTLSRHHSRSCNPGTAWSPLLTGSAIETKTFCRNIRDSCDGWGTWLTKAPTGSAVMGGKGDCVPSAFSLALCLPPHPASYPLPPPGQGP